MIPIILAGNKRSGTPPSLAPQEGVLNSEDAGKVVIVEDEWLVAMELEAALEDAGHRVVGVAQSADEAVRMAEMHHPDLVLMDIRLKGARDGVDAAIEIFRRFGIRSIFVSAHSDAGTKERARVANPLEWIPKPFGTPQVIRAVAAALLAIRRG